LEPTSCVVLVPVATSVEPECEAALHVLEQRGYEVRRTLGYSAIDLARNHMAHDALESGFDELMWIDSDIGFDPDAVEMLRAHALPIACGVYTKRGGNAIAANLLPPARRIMFGALGGLVEILYGATGFLHTRAEVYHTIRDKLALPTCNQRYGRPFVPYFLPSVVPDPDIVPVGSAHRYFGEDFAFQDRARKCGFRVMADTRIRLRHFGRYVYQWEDAGGAVKRYASYDLTTPE